MELSWWGIQSGSRCFLCKECAENNNYYMFFTWPIVAGFLEGGWSKIGYARIYFGYGEMLE